MNIWKVVALVAVFVPFSAHAVPFSGKVYDVYLNNSVALAKAHISDASNTPVIEFTTSSIPSMTGGTANKVKDVLGANAITFSGDENKRFSSTLFHITGYVDLTETLHTFRIGANDGFHLTIGGNEILSSNTQGTQTKSAMVGAGPQTFELIYFNNADKGNFTLTIDGGSVAASDGPAVPLATTPLPAGLPLLLAGLGALAVVGRKRVA